MSRAADRLREFHEAFEVEAADTNDLESVKRVAKARERLHEEEHRELLKALEIHIRFGSRPGRSVARELADLLVIAYGTADLFDIDLDAAFDAVMDANMAKLPKCEACDGSGRHGWLARAGRKGAPLPCPVCLGTGKGEPIRRESDGKIERPPGWREPDMSVAIK